MGNVMNLGRMSGDLPQMVSSGELTCYLSTVRFTQWVPEIAVIDLPFIVKDRKTNVDYYAKCETHSKHSLYEI
jgi:TRAP-type C4-dicarboxylate transport system substrate-binding protein